MALAPEMVFSSLILKTELVPVNLLGESTVPKLLLGTKFVFLDYSQAG